MTRVKISDKEVYPESLDPHPSLISKPVTQALLWHTPDVFLAYPYARRKSHLLIPSDFALSSRSEAAAGDWGICGRFLTKTSISRPGLGTGLTYYPINTAARLNPSPLGSFPVNGRAMGQNR